MLPDRELHLLSKTISWTPKDSMRVEMGGFLPEPAVGVFTTAGTCQGRLRRHS